MSRLLTRLSTLLFGLFVVGGLAFGASTVVAVPSVNSCGYPGQIGSCPPYDDASCHHDCLLIYGNPGGQCADGCCDCPI